MAFKDLHKLKKIAEVQKEFIETDYLVVGKDIFAMSIYRELVLKHGEEKVKLLSEDKITKSDLFIKGPSTIRGETNKKVLTELYPEIQNEAIDLTSLYYKDMIWKPFGGRSKPEALKYDEEFYVSPRLNLKEEEFFVWLKDNPNFLDHYNEISYQLKIKNINYKNDQYLVECTNGTEFQTKNLFFGKSPAYFLDHYAEKNHLSDHFIQFCESTKTVHGLFIRYEMQKPLTDLKETLFIPLSYTHEWGHFVGEFKEIDGKYYADFLHYIDEDHTSEEEISRFIRQLKKSFEKIFENFTKIKFQEYIYIEDEMACLNIDDHSFDLAMQDSSDYLNQLHFVGVNAPLSKEQCVSLGFEDSKKLVTQFTRGVIVDKFAVSKI
jgi:hypothetical protein